MLRRVWEVNQRDNLGLIAAGVAFYCLLALFPAISALVAISGLFLLDPGQVVEQMGTATALLPEGARTIILDQAQAVATSGTDGLGLAVIIGLVVALVSASRGVGALIGGLNIAYDEVEYRSLVRLFALNVGLTALLIAGLIIALTLAAAVPAALSLVLVDTAPRWLATAGSFVVLGLLFAASLAVLYRVGPARTHARWQWLSVGSLLATIVFVAGSAGFAFFVTNFGTFNESFGSLAGVVILLLWLWLSAFIVLLGASLNGELEAQTKVDSTVGEPKHMGERGAIKADRLGRLYG